ncbi:MAG: hypothetical protein ACM3PC_12600 [Deltaproteobacteria bacterium]
MQTTGKGAATFAAALLLLSAACGGGSPAGSGRQLTARSSSNLDSVNGLLAMSIDGACLTIDGTYGTVDPTASTDSCGDMMNGLSPNLLGLNGLHPNGLHTPQFEKWFAADPAAANMMMKYLVKCSLPFAETLTYTADDGSTYSWPGTFGLAPRWASGKAIPEHEQELVSACVAAHANKYGAHVPISVLGRRADGTPLPVSAAELAGFPLREGCFFGNLFHKDGVFSGDDRTLSLGDADSSLRACALPDRSGGGASSNCAPMQYAGSCRDICKTDESGLYYVSCKVRGKSYRALSTRIRPEVNFTCGDGVCQATESCGTGTAFNDCGLDCGPCK